MGTLFSKKEKSRITEQDRAVLGLKKQRDQLKQYQKRILGDLEKEKELAKKYLKEGKKDRAKLLLRKKKFQEGLIEKTDAQLDQLERLVNDLEFAQVQQQVLSGLKSGNEALNRANSVFSVEDIEDILADTEEAVEKQKEINDLLAGELTQVSWRSRIKNSHRPPSSLMRTAQVCLSVPADLGMHSLFVTSK